MEAWPPYLTGFFVIIICSAYVKCLTTFSILRYGIGLSGAGFGLVLTALSLALTLMILAPQLETAGGIGGLFSSAPADAAVLQRIAPMLQKQTDPELLKKFSDMASRLRSEEGQKTELKDDSRFSILAAAFLVSEIGEAFRIGFMILIPFLVIDLLVTNVLLLLGATQISHAVVALPIKILFFFVLDGWALLSEKLVGGYL